MCAPAPESGLWRSLWRMAMRRGIVCRRNTRRLRSCTVRAVVTLSPWRAFVASLALRSVRFPLRLQSTAHFLFCVWDGAGAVGELESLTGTLEAQLLRLLQAQGGEAALAAAQSRLPPSRSPEALAARRFDSSSGSDDGAPATPGKGILSAVEAVLHSPASQRSAGRGSRRRTPSSSARASHLQRGALHLSASQREGREVENVFRVLAQQMRAHRKLFGQVRPQHSRAAVADRDATAL